MRRKDREVTDPKEIEGILGRNQVCTLSMAVDGEPYGVMLNYGFEMDESGKLTLYFHSAAQGRKLEMMLKNPRVAFSVFGSMEVIAKETPCEYTALYEAIMGVGKIRFIEDNHQKRRALDILMHNHNMAGTGEYADEMLARVAVFCLDAEQYSAKQNSR